MLKLLANAGCERPRVWSQVEACVIGVTTDSEVPRKIVVRIAIAVRSDNPDLLGADAVTQLGEDAKLVADPVHTDIVIDDRTAPSGRNNLVNRHIDRNSRTESRLGSMRR